MKPFRHPNCCGGARSTISSAEFCMFLETVSESVFALSFTLRWQGERPQGEIDTDAPVSTTNSRTWEFPSGTSILTLQVILSLAAAVSLILSRHNTASSGTTTSIISLTAELHTLAKCPFLPYLLQFTEAAGQFLPFAKCFLEPHLWHLYCLRSVFLLLPRSGAVALVGRAPLCPQKCSFDAPSACTGAVGSVSAEDKAQHF